MNEHERLLIRREKLIQQREVLSRRPTLQARPTFAQAMASYRIRQEPLHSSGSTDNEVPEDMEAAIQCMPGFQSLDPTAQRAWRRRLASSTQRKYRDIWRRLISSARARNNDSCTWEHLIKNRHSVQANFTAPLLESNAGLATATNAAVEAVLSLKDNAEAAATAVSRLARKRARTPTKARQAIDLEPLIRLLAAPENKRTLKEKRDLLIVALRADTAMRSDDVASVFRSSISFSHRGMSYRIWEPKEGKARGVFGDERFLARCPQDPASCTVSKVERYLAATNDATPDRSIYHANGETSRELSLFVSSSAPFKSLKASTLGSLAKPILLEAEIQDTAHALRGAALTHMIEAGCNKQTVLRYANISETVFTKHYFHPLYPTYDGITSLPPNSHPMLFLRRKRLDHLQLEGVADEPLS